MSSLQDTVGKVISGYYGQDRKEFGNPVINASYGGNFYAWSDSTGDTSCYKIISAWKTPTARTFQNMNKDTIAFNLWRGFAIVADTLKHPSLNVYSNIDKNEDNCALVFQGHLVAIPTGQGQIPTLPNNWNVFYTRLKHTVTGLKRYIPGTFRNTNYMVDTCFRIARLTDYEGIGENDNTFPTVVRDLSNYNFKPLSLTVPNRKDRIYWQVQSTSSARKYLGKRAVNLYDTSNVPLRWNVYPYTLIKSNSSKLNEPNVNNSSSISDNGNDIVGNLILNFTAKRLTLNTLQQVWQYSDYFSSTFTNDSVLNIYPVTQNMYLGQQPHLSNNQSIYDKLWKNRRVFESDTVSPPRILSSAKYYYRSLAENEILCDALIGYTNDSTYYYLNVPLLNGTELPMYLPYTKTTDSTFEPYYELVQRDTIFSEWFKVENDAQIEFKCFGFDTSKVLVKIHQQFTNNFIPLTIPDVTTDSTGILRQFTLVNGQGFTYRLEFINMDTLSHYSEQLFIEGLPVSDTMMARTIIDNHEIIDLHGKEGNTSTEDISLSLFPNPADENVYTTAYLPLSAFTGRSQHQIIIKVFSSLGFELFRQEVKSGETISIPTKDYPQGAYFIRAEEKADDYTIDVLPAKVQGFVIKR